MRKKIIGVLILLMTMVSCAGIFSACGASRNDLKLESETESIELVLGDSENETSKVEVSIEGFGDGISGLVGFEVLGECARVESVSTAADKGRSSCVLRAIRSGNSKLRATMFDGGASLIIPISVEQKVVSMTAKMDYKPFFVEGGEKLVFDAEKLINFNPISTTQREVEFKIGGKIVDGIDDETETDGGDSVTVEAVSKENANIKTEFTVRLIKQIAITSTRVGGSESADVVLAVNSQDKNKATVEIEVESEESVVCLNGFHTGSDFTICKIGQTRSGNSHTFTFEVSGVEGEKTGTYAFKFGVGEEFDYFVTSKVEISTIIVATKIGINLETSNYSTINAFNHTFGSSKGVPFTFCVLPSNVNSKQRTGKIEYDDGVIFVVDSTGKTIPSGASVQSDAKLFVKGVSSVDGGTTAAITFTVLGIEGVVEEVVAQVPVVVHTGATAIDGKNSIVLKLSSDGSAGEVVEYDFSVLPEGAYSSGVKVEAKSTIIAIDENASQNKIKIKGLSVGKTKLVLTLENGISKEVDVQVVCEMDENTLMLDAPSSSQSEFVGKKEPVVASVGSPLENIVIQKSTSVSEKRIPLYFSYQPQNASNVKYTYTIEDPKVVEVVGNSLVGKDVGTTKVFAEVSFDKLGENGEIARGTKTFEFCVEVYVAVSSFSFPETSITLADIKDVGYFKSDDAIKKLVPKINPADATNKNIVYYVDPVTSNADGVYKNNYMTFDSKTGEIKGEVDSYSGGSTTIIATLEDYNRVYSVTIHVEVKKQTKVKSIIVDNVSNNLITLSATNPNFLVRAYASNENEADNKTLRYSFTKNVGNPDGLVSVDQNGLVSLDNDKLQSYITSSTDFGTLGGTLYISAEDSFSSAQDAIIFYPIKVVVQVGTKDSPYHITAAEELLALNSEAALSKFYKIVGVIDLKNKPISPLGTLTGGIVGTSGSKIVGINLTGDKDGCVGLFSEIASGATIENVAFSGAINYFGAAKNIGLVAGVNNGTIENCSVNIANSSIESTCENDNDSVFVGGMFGVNNGSITTTIKSGNPNYNLAIFGGRMSVEAGENSKVYVGGVVGKNSENKQILRKVDKSVSLFGTDGYSANVNIKTTGVSATGAIAGLNEGKLLSLSSCGDIEGGDNVGGFVGQNSGIIGRDDDENNSARSFSNTFVKGGNNVGGFVGQNSNKITDSGVEIYQSNQEVVGKYIASATGNVGGFVGSFEQGSISKCYVISFRTDKVDFVFMNSNKESTFAGAFVGAGSYIPMDCYSNITVQSVGKGTTKTETFNAEIDVMPTNPDEIKLDIKEENKMTLEGVGEEGLKVIWLGFYQAKDANQQAALDAFNSIMLGDYIEHNLEDAADIVSSDPSILKVGADGLKVLSQGLCKLTITSRFDSTKTDSVHVFVVGVNGDIDIDQKVQGMTFPITSGSTFSFLPNQVVSFGKNSTSATIDGSETVVGSNYDIQISSFDATIDGKQLTDCPFSITNFKNLLTLKVSDKFSVGDEEIKKPFDVEFELSGHYVVEIGGKKYVSQSFSKEPIELNARIVIGTTSLNLQSSNFDMCANDQLRIQFSCESALEEEEQLCVSASQTIFVDGKRVARGVKQQITKGQKGEFVVELENKNFYGTLKLVITDKNSTYQKIVDVNVLPQSVEAISTRYYDLEKPDVNSASTTSLITPGKMGSILLDIIPDFSDIAYVTITNASTNSAQVSFELVDNSFVKKNGAILVDGGLKIPRLLFEKNGKFETIYLRTLLQTQIADNQPLTLIVETSDGYRKEFILTTKHTEKVEGSIENKNVGGDVELAIGLDYSLNINSIGFSSDQICVETKSDAVTISRVSDFGYVIHANSVTSSQKVEIVVYGKKEVDGMEVKTTPQTISVVIKDFVVYEKLNFAGASDDSLMGEYDIVFGYVGVSKELKISLVNGVNCEYDINNSSAVQKLKAFEADLNEIGQFGYWGNGFEVIGKDEENEEFKFKANNIVSPKKKMTAQESQTIFKFSVEIGDVNFTATMKMEVDNISSALSMIPIENEQDFMNMTEGNYYILVEDITLDNNFKPITANIAGFDGNNKKITISRFEREREDEETVFNFGLFEEVAEGTIIQNVHIHLDNFSTTILAESLNFGFIAATNFGVITNCFVEGDSAKIAVVESSSKANKIAAIVAQNNGFITNSRVEISIFSGFGDVAGIAVSNSGIISSSYVKNTTIINNSISTSAMTAGIVCQNLSVARIFGCFVEGGAFEKDDNGKDKIYCDKSVSIRANSKIAAFVFQNGGEIQDSYANIHVNSGSVASGFVYENQQTGSILNSFSLCLLKENMNSNYAFVALDPAGVVNTTAGKFESCYFCKEVNPWQNISSQTFAGIGCLEKMLDFGYAENFETFGLSSDLAPEKGVWALKSSLYQSYSHPRLISAENIISISKELELRQVDAETGYITYSYSNMPDGSKTNPFIVTNAKELEQVILATTKKDNTCLSYVRLVANIDYSDEQNGVELSGLHNVVFCGEFDGNGLKISGLKINSKEKVDSAGFFAAIGTERKVGVVKNLILIPDQINLPNSSKTGALAGSVVGSGIYNVSIEVSNVTDVVIVVGKNFVGGFVGHVKNSSTFNSQIINCSSELNVNATAFNQTSEQSRKDSCAIYVPTQTIVNLNLAAVSGGLVGYLQSGSLIFCCSSAKTVMGQISGGLVGYVGSSAKVKKSHTSISEGSCVRTSFVGGGLAGVNVGEISASTVVGNANSYFPNASFVAVAVGGMVGINSGKIVYSEIEQAKVLLDIDNIDIDYVGGIAGIMTKGEIQGYAIESNLQGCLYVGGVVGAFNNGTGTATVKNCKIGAFSDDDEEKGTETRICAYGFESNYVGVVCAFSSGRMIVASHNTCSNNVLFSRTWLSGGTGSDSFIDKTVSEYESDYFNKDYITSTNQKGND